MTRPAMVLGIAATLVLGLGVALFVLVRQDSAPVVATPGAPPSATPEPDRRVGAPTVQIHHPAAPAPAAAAPASPSGDDSPTPAPAGPGPVAEPPQREGRHVPATVKATGPIERIERPVPDPNAKGADELKRRGNRRFTNGLLPMLSPTPAPPPPVAAPAPAPTP